MDEPCLPCLPEVLEMTATLSTLRPGAHFQVTAPSWDREKPRPVYELLALSACAARTTLGWIALSTDVD